MLFSSKLNKKHVEDMSIRVGDSIINSKDCIRNLGAYFTPHMDMEKHVNIICRSSYYQLRNIGRIRKFLTVDATPSSETHGTHTL
ncbi:hypothetical protein ACF0H5_014321 [Mactra antiquata]